ncbi:MAG: type 2 isopentenyl-diphosphate Delta-isomerase [Candidatus Micrarchaeota archaeon]
MSQIKKRKEEHVEITLKKDVDYKLKRTGFNDVELLYYALPEINYKEVSTQTNFLGFKLKAPLLISSMTGGYEKATKINRDLVTAAQEEGVMVGLGSMRAMLKHPELWKTYYFKKEAPKAIVFANFGAVQLLEYSPKQVSDAVKKIEADGCFIHLNALQEVIQPEGDKNWRNVLQKISKLCDHSDFPIIIKEVGAGINGEIARELQEAGVKAIDVAGAGGTSWTGIEVHRNGAPEGSYYWDFGIPTLSALRQCKKTCSLPLIASGGIRSGLDCAKAIRFGAELCGAAKPFLKAQAKKGKKGVVEEIQSFKRGLEIAMFLTRSKNLDQLQRAKLLTD